MIKDLMKNVDVVSAYNNVVGTLDGDDDIQC